VVRDAQLILIAGALLASGVLASLLAARLRLPALVLFLGVGMLIGTDGLGWIDFDNYPLARLIGTVALALILFEGGLATGLPEVRPVLAPAVALAVVGTAGTALLAGIAAIALFDLSPPEGLLVGAIVSATDGAAIFALLRGSPLPRRIARTLEGEAGLDDPVAVLLVLAIIEFIRRPDYGLGDAALFFVQQLGIGTALGLAVGWASARVLGRAPSLPAGLGLVASLATAAVAYGAATALHGSGFLAVYLAGLVLGTPALPTQRSRLAFHEGLASVAEIGMFFTLGLLVFPSQLGDVLVEGTLLALVVAFVARPIAAGLATSVGGFSTEERIVLAWAGLRGAVPVVLATFPVIEGIPRSLEFFNIVFFAVLVSTVIQGSTIGALARRLNVVDDGPPAGDALRA